MDLTEYKSSTIRRRINRRLAATHTASYLDYAVLLDQEPDEYKRLIECLTIKVSSFFRDPTVFEILRHQIWPKIIQEKRLKEERSIRIWSAGCATGKEAYSLAILLAELLKEEARLWDISIFATDIDQQSLIKGKKGVYAEEDLDGVEKCIIDKYFTIYYLAWPAKLRRIIKVNNFFKEWIYFTYHDLVSGETLSPREGIITDFDMILCRNVLMYFSRALQEKILQNFSSVLNQGNYLVLGKNEWIGYNQAFQWKEVKEGLRIYQKL